jgi:outer membrane protein assembly factor BamD
LLWRRLLTGGCGFHRKKYENPITKNTDQPDKVLFPTTSMTLRRALRVARLTLNTMINTYDSSSEYLAKAKLAIADSWMRQSGPEGLAQAEAEYKDFQLFYPHHAGSSRGSGQDLRDSCPADGEGRRDPNNALRAEQECPRFAGQVSQQQICAGDRTASARDPGSLAQSEMVAGLLHRPLPSRPPPTV